MKVRLAERTEGELRLARTVEAAAASKDLGAYKVGVPALVEGLRGLRALQLTAVIDLAERMDAAVLRGDVEGRERVRREFGVGG